MAKRGPYEIIADLLRAVKETHRGAEDRVAPSRLASRIYVSWDCFERYLSIASEQGLVDGLNSVTARGERFLRLFRELQELVTSES